jgi:hypothetical protein
MLQTGRLPLSVFNIDGSTAHGDQRRELQALPVITAVACARELQQKVAS